MQGDFETRLVLGAWGENPAFDDFRASIILEALAQIAERAYRSFPDLPSIYDGSVRYSFEGERADFFRDIGAVFRRGKGDCDNLSPVRVGELRARYGIAARVGFRKWFEGGRPRYHVIVLLPDGSTEDPSRALGMQGTG